MNNNYPILLKPAIYTQVETLMPILPQKPEEPQLKLVKKNWFESLILWCDDYDDMRINERRKMEYESKMVKYRSDMVDYQKRVSDLLKETNLTAFRQRTRAEIMKRTTRAEGLSRDVIRGRYEESFYRRLNKEFPGMIKTDLEFEISNGNAYIPDFAYVDTSTGLCIDIEIDEPYVLPSGVPCHYEGADDYRNSFFMAKGWFVMRFAEEQIARYPEECIAYIRTNVERILTGGESIQFAHSRPLWSMSDSFRMFRDNYRNLY